MCWVTGPIPVRYAVRGTNCTIALGARLAQLSLERCGTDRSMAMVDTKRDVEMVVQKNLHAIFQRHCELSGISILVYNSAWL